MADQDVKDLVERIEQDLLPQLKLESVKPSDPVVVLAVVVAGAATGCAFEAAPTAMPTATANAVVAVASPA